MAFTITMLCYQVNLFGQSDPFVEVKSVDQMVKTKTKYGTINPEWNERVNVLVYDKDSQIVDLTVYDSDISRMNTLLGRSTVKLSSVPPNVKTNKTLLLADVDTGSIEVLLEYIPISAAGSSTKNALTEEDDVLFTLTKEALTDEMLLHDEETELLLEANTDDPSSNGDGRGGRAMLSRGALDMISTPTRGKSGE